jgi:hypothetical protein
MSICQIEDCDKDSYCRGRCGPHYRLLLLEGERLFRRATASIEERFWCKVDKSGPVPVHGVVPGRCWQWIGGTVNRGYGQFQAENMRRTQAHRYAWETLRGQIPDLLTIDHLCRNRLCVNPDHMEVVTRAENVLRAVDIGAPNRNKTHCNKGHEFTAENTRMASRSGGRIHRRCRTCDRDRERNRKRRPASTALAAQAAEAADAYHNEGHLG